MKKSSKAYKTIGEVAEILELESTGSKKNTHTIRYWETQFKQIKPKKLTGNRRYYDQDNVELLKKVHFLLKEQGMTINGVKKILENKEALKLDETKNASIKANNIKNKLVKISNLVKNLKDLK